MVAIYTISLHPISSFFGGLVFIFTAWLLPTLMNIFLTLWIISFFKLRKIIAILLFLPISFILGINTNFISGYEYYTAEEQKIDCKIKEVINIKEQDRIIIENTNDAEAKKLSLTKNVFSPMVLVAFDEACMCWYFEPAKRESFYLPGFIPYEYRKNQYRKNFDKIAKYRLALTKEKINGKYANLRVTIYDGQKETASFVKNNFRYYEYKKEFVFSKRSENFLNEYFSLNVFHLLLRDNVWSRLLEELIDKDSSYGDEINKFLNKAITFGNQNKALERLLPNIKENKQTIIPNKNN